jgi:TonB family protein
MTSPLDLLLRSSATLAIALAVAGLLRQRSAALRHCLVAVGLFAAGLLVPIGGLLPAWTVSVPRPAAVLAPGTPEAAIVAPFASAGDMPANTGPALAALLLATWTAGAAIGLLALLASMMRFQRIASRAVPIIDGPWPAIADECAVRAGVRRPVALLETTVPGVLATWGVLRPRILVPVHARGWTEARIRAVLQHELAHVRRCDWGVQVAAEAMRALHWCNPLFWIACRRLRLESERACDDAVLREGLAADDYAAHLVDIVRSTRRSSVPAAALMPMARPSTLHRRIAAMLNTRLPRGPISGRAIALVTIGLVCLALPIASLRAGQEGSHPLSGFVYDPTGAVVPGATVTLQDERENNWQTVSDGTGHFEFSPVSTGKYVLGASLAGFRTLRQPIELRTARDWTRAVTLQVGDLRETIVIKEKRMTPASAGALAGDAAPLRVGGSIRPPRKVRDVHPVYPRSMREAGLEGVVPLEAIIGRGGTVQSVRVLSAQVHPDFARAAIDAVREWRFDPTLLNGKPVEVVMNVSVEFALDE